MVWYGSQVGSVVVEIFFLYVNNCFDFIFFSLFMFIL